MVGRDEQCKIRPADYINHKGAKVKIKNILLHLSLILCSLMLSNPLMAVESSSIDVDMDAYIEDLTFIAKEPRNSTIPETEFSNPADKSDHHDTVMFMCRDRLENLGYTTVLDEYEYNYDFTMFQTPITYPAKGVNVIGTMKGKVNPEKIIIVSAHYDSVPECNGADDNGAGVAGLLETARILAQYDFENTLVIAFWDEEEEGLLGSRHYAQEARFRNDDIIVNYVYEMIGYKSDEIGSQKIPLGLFWLYPLETLKIRLNGSRGDFIAVIHDDKSTDIATGMHEFAEIESLSLVRLGIKDPVATGLSHNFFRSDHSPFWDEGYPAMMISDTANFRNENYHCIGGYDDDVDTLDHDFAVQVIKVTTMSAFNELKVME